jgi:two-component system chemotaxis response regulator CheY
VIGIVKILIVDDSSFMREMLRGILQSEGYDEIFEAANGEIAVKEYRKHRPDIVFMDIVMEHKDGISALQEIRGVDKEAKVVMVSVLGHDAMKEQAEKAGAKHFITKPFQESQIVEMVREILAE